MDLGFRMFYALCMVFFLAACGGGSTDETNSTASPTATTPPPVSPKKAEPILLMGPSTVYIAHELNEAVDEDGNDCRLEGWGERLWMYASDDDIASGILNYAQPGANTQRFQIPPEQRRGNEPLLYGPQRDHYWAKVVEKMQKLGHGILLIQFGANGDNEEQFKNNMRTFIRTARENNFTPVLLTELAKRRHTAEGSYDPGRGQEIEWMRAIAQETQTRLLDLFQKSSQIYSSMSEAQWDTEFANCYSRWYSGDTPPKQDTHLEPRGAKKVALWVRDLACEDTQSTLCQELQGTPKSIQLSSSRTIPEHDIPSISWQNIPKGTKSLAVIIDDHNANHWVHWAAANIDPKRTAIAAGEVPQEARILNNQLEDKGYVDPSYPHDHMYEIHLYALDIAKISEAHHMQGTQKVSIFDPEKTYNHLDFEKHFRNFIIDKASFFFEH